MIINHISSKDIPLVIDTMVDSFANDNLYSYFFTDAERRLKFLNSFLRFRLKFGMKYGNVYVTDDLKGVAIWLLPNIHMKPRDFLLLGGFSTLLFKCNSAERKRIMNFVSFIEEMKENLITQPFFHLSPICVARDFQGKGYGKQLLDLGLKDVKKSGVPCYLETQSHKNVNFYKKMGFTEMKREFLPESNIENIGMIFEN